jgi:hypothetical protein
VLRSYITPREQISRHKITVPSANPYAALDTALDTALAEHGSKDESFARLREQNEESADRGPSSPEITEPRAEMRGTAANEDGWVVVGGRKRTIRMDETEEHDGPHYTIVSSVEASGTTSPAALSVEASGASSPTASSVEVSFGNRDVTPDTESEAEAEQKEEESSEVLHEKQIKKKRRRGRKGGKKANKKAAEDRQDTATEDVADSKQPVDIQARLSEPKAKSTMDVFPNLSAQHLAAVDDNAAIVEPSPSIAPTEMDKPVELQLDLPLESMADSETAEDLLAATSADDVAVQPQAKDVPVTSADTVKHGRPIERPHAPLAPSANPGWKKPKKLAKANAMVIEVVEPVVDETEDDLPAVMLGDEEFVGVDDHVESVNVSSSQPAPEKKNRKRGKKGGKKVQKQAARKGGVKLNQLQVALGAVCVAAVSVGATLWLKFG